MMSARGKQIELGPIKLDAKAPMALAPYEAIAAITAPDLKLHVVDASGDEAVRSSAELSPTLHASPASMTWSNDGRLLAASFDDGTWTLFRPFGFWR